jgi:purine-binding chemotaxis protein CheW
MTDLLLFRVGDELFAAELRAVEEALDLEGVQRVPGTAPAVTGVFTLRGVLVPLFSPAGVLGVAPRTGGTALVVRDGLDRVAIVADDVDDVMTLGDGELGPLPAGDPRDAAVLRGLVRRGRDLVAVVDVDALVAACRAASQPEAA